MSYPNHRDHQDGERDLQEVAEAGWRNHNNNHQPHPNRHPPLSPPAPYHSHPSGTGKYNSDIRTARGEGGTSGTVQGSYGGSETNHEKQEYSRRRDWDKPTGGDMYSDKDQEREWNDEHNDWDRNRGSSRENLHPRGSGVNPGGNRDRPRSRSQSRGRSHSRNRGRSYRDRDTQWAQRDHAQEYRDRDRPRSRLHSRGRSSSRNQGHSYRDRDNYWARGGNDRGDRNRDRDHDHDRHRDRKRSPFFGAPPCRDVILEGFGFETSEDDILQELDNLGVEGVEAMNIIRDRNTGQSRGFGFARFSTIALAKRFLSDHYPSMRMFADGTKVKCAFSRAGGGGSEDVDMGRQGRDGGDKWTCRVCLMLNFFRRLDCCNCGTPNSDTSLTAHGTHPAPTSFQNDGSPDMEETTVSQFLLLRELAEGVGEELLAKGVQKLLVPDLTEQPQGDANPRSGPAAVEVGARQGSVKRVLLVRDRRTGESWRFGFVEFATVEDSKAAFEKYQKLEKFTIASKLVTVSFIHSGVFIPVYSPSSKGQNLEKYTFLGSTGLRLKYWDEEGYVSEMVVTPTASIGPSENVTEKDRSDGTSKGKKRKADLEKTGATTAPAATAGAKKALPVHLQFWKDRHMELHGVIAPPHNSDGESGAASDDSAKKPKRKKGTALGAVTGVTIPAGAGSSDSAGTVPLAVPPSGAGGDGPPTESFADLNRLACILCSRQFKSVPEVHKHERISKLHRSNLADEELVTKARGKLEKAGIKQTTSNDTTTALVYRDRAKERRAVFGQPKKPDTAANDTVAAASTSTATNARPPSPNPMPSKGAALLSKMGWTSGLGLGLEGKGITAPVVAEMYREGVGLGAQGGKVGEASAVSAMNTAGGYKEFVRRTKEKAKERYAGMS